MSEFLKIDRADSAAMRRRREEVLLRAAERNIDTSSPGTQVKKGSVAVYCHVADYKPDQMFEQIVLCHEFARDLSDHDPIHFSDWNRSVPELRKLISFAEQGLIKAVVFKDVQTFNFCDPRAMGAYLRELSDAGAEIHFADASLINQLIKMPAPQIEMASVGN